MHGLFNRIKRLVAMKPPVARLTVEEQLLHLKEIGISLKPNVDYKKRLDFNEIRKYEETSYIHLLVFMGEEEDGTTDSYLSNDVWCFDRECIDDHGDYVLKMKRIANMVAPYIRVTDFQDYVNFETGECWIAFSVNGTEHRYSLTLQDDWMSIEIFMIFSDTYGCGKRFFFSDIGNELLVVLIEWDHFRLLTKLINIFMPANLRRTP